MINEERICAAAAGRTGGRRPKLTQRQVEMARQVHASGEHTVTAIAEVLGVARPTIYRALNCVHASQSINHEK